ncbi:MAG: aminotransferase class I/II-fold pyridoxal phosphate-dependent enzyme [Flavobacterium sp.]
MQNFPSSLSKKLDKRLEDNALRKLGCQSSLIDFASNDYLGFSESKVIFEKTHELLLQKGISSNGATGSRLLSGNHTLYTDAEQMLCVFHESVAALIFNSGYDANIGFFGSVPQRGEIVLYDELCHASIRDGLLLSNAKSIKFTHNDCEHLQKLIERFSGNTIYIVTETVFSMDGDCPPIEEIVKIAEKNNCFLIVDEAHALGVMGEKGQGLLQSLNLHNRVFARVVTFGKALGCHGAAVLGSNQLTQYLVNFARSFIYTTGLSPHSVATIMVGYNQLANDSKSLENLRSNIIYFNQQKKLLGLTPLFVRSYSSIQCAIIQGNENVKNLANLFQANGFDVKAILSPTVPAGQERLRFCVHSFNTKLQIDGILNFLATSIFK